MEIEKIIQLAEDTKNEVTELCTGLVKINSAHPDGFTDDVVAYIKEFLDNNGIDNKIHAKDSKKPNIVAKVRGESKKTVLWLGHIDVVPEGKIESWLYPPYNGKIANGMIWGRGSSDMKGSCASAMVSAKILNMMNYVPNNVEFWFTCDEEIGGGLGAQWLAETGRLKGDVCIIGDGHGGGLNTPSIDIGCKGRASTKIIAEGKTAHGSTPFLGDNAISKLINTIPWVEKIDSFDLDFPRELELAIKSSIDFFKSEQELTPEQAKIMEYNYYTPSISCNIINGGIKINVVPDYAEAEYDIRLTPGSTISRVRDKIQELIKESGITEIKLKPISPSIDNKAGYFESPDSSFVYQLSEVVTKITGKEVNMKILQGGTDGIRVKKIAGISCLGYGTGLTGQAHMPDEHISIENLVLGVKVYTAFPIIYS